MHKIYKMENRDCAKIEHTRGHKTKVTRFKQISKLKVNLLDVALLTLATVTHHLYLESTHE